MNHQNKKMKYNKIIKQKRLVFFNFFYNYNFQAFKDDYIYDHNNIEDVLRLLLDRKDVFIFDVHFILSMLRKKYQKNYSLSLGIIKFK